RPAPTASLDGVAFTVPDGGVYRPVVEGIGCVAPAAPPPGEGVPHGVELRVGVRAAWPADGLDRADGWSATPGDCAGPSAARIVERGTRDIGGHIAVYRVWDVRCPGEPARRVRVWWVAEAALTVYSAGLDAGHNPVV